jgi:hypothetical protein
MLCVLTNCMECVNVCFVMRRLAWVYAAEPPVEEGKLRTAAAPGVQGTGTRAAL